MVTKGGQLVARGLCSAYQTLCMWLLLWAEDFLFLC